MTITYTKIQSRQYKASTGEIAVFYTSKQYGEKNSKGWYICYPDGSQGSTRFLTLGAVKEHLHLEHKFAA
jgi:hypothetical protein